MNMTWKEIRKVLEASSDLEPTNGANHKPAIHALLDGPPGTGKSTLAASMAAGKGVYTVTITDDTSAPDLIGHFVLNKQGGYEYHYGPAIRAWKEGSLLVMNEIDHAQGGCEIIAHAILDDPEVARLTLANGEVVTPAPGFRVIATMNGDRHDLHPALLDRFGIRVTIDQPSPEALGTLSPHVREICSNWYNNKDSRFTFRMAQNYDRLSRVVETQIASKAVFDKDAAEVMKVIKMVAVD